MRPWNRLTTRQKDVRIWWQIGLSALVIGLLGGFDHSPSGSVPAWSTVLTFGGGALLFLGGAFWFLRLCVQVGMDTGNAISRVSRPLPSPAEIELALWKEWGRQPSVEEIAAVQQMLVNQRNQDLLQAGIGLSAIYLINRDHRI